MAQAVLRIEGLPEEAVDAAARFYGEWLPKARALLDPPLAGEDLVLVFPPADHTHRAWRLAAVQNLAREAPPRRVNAIAGNEEQAIAAALAWLADALGITGQLLEVG